MAEVATSGLAGGGAQQSRHGRPSACDRDWSAPCSGIREEAWPRLPVQTGRDAPPLRTPPPAECVAARAAFCLLYSSFPSSFFLFLLEPHRAADAGAPRRRRVLWGGPKEAVPVNSLSAMTTVEAADETGNRQCPLAGSVGGRPHGSVRLGGCGGGHTSGRPRPVHPPPT